MNEPCRRQKTPKAARCQYPRCACDEGNCFAKQNAPIQATIPNRLHGAAINAEGDAI